MGSTISEMKTTTHNNRETKDNDENCFDVLLLLPELVGGKLRKRDNNGNAIVDVITTSQQSCEEKEILPHLQDRDSEDGVRNENKKVDDTKRSSSSSRSRSATQSLSKILDDSGAPFDEFFLTAPRCVHDPVGLKLTMGGGQHLSRWERPTKRPKALYPSGVLKNPIEPVLSEQCVCDRNYASSYCHAEEAGLVVHPKAAAAGRINRATKKMDSHFQVKQNLFIPIHSDSSDGDSSSGELVLGSEAAPSAADRLSTPPQQQPLPFMPRSTMRSGNRSVPKLPKLTLKPRNPSSNRLRPRFDHI